jgi:flavin reductase (DIM6/NTAB) family NADH-FMN oxidoreductase RutF
MSDQTGTTEPPGRPDSNQPLDEATADAVDAVYHLYDPPLWLVTSAESADPGSTRGGCIATFVERGSIVRDRPRMVLGIARQHHTWRMIEASGRLAVHLFPETAIDLVWRFGLASGKDRDKFAALSDERTPLGCPRVPGTSAWLDCRVEARMDTGDRTLYLASVLSGGVSDPAAAPLTAGRLMALAPADKRAELDRLYARDGAIDAAAIDAWRSARRAD